MIKKLINISRKLILLIYPLKNMEFNFNPLFLSYDELIDQVYRLTWYLPVRNNIKITLFYTKFNFEKEDLINDKNRPWYMHSLPVNLENLNIIRCKSEFNFKRTLLIKAFLGSYVIEWKKSNSFFNRLIGYSGEIITVDHTNLSYISDINYVTLLIKTKEPEYLSSICDISKSNFQDKIGSLKSKYNKSYIFGRGPSLDKVYNYDLSDGVRIICNQTVNNIDLLNKIKPHIIVACDHCWHMGCSKLADNFRKDAIKWIINNDAIFILPLDSYPIMVEHYPELKGKIAGVPYGGKNHNFDLLSEYRTKPTLGVLFEFLFPVASTISNEILMIGFDGNDRPDEKRPDDKKILRSSKEAEYSDNIVASIHHSRPGYYDRDFTEFRSEYDKLFVEVIKDAEKKGFRFKTLAPSFHTALKDKYVES